MSTLTRPRRIGHAFGIAISTFNLILPLVDTRQGPPPAVVALGYVLGLCVIALLAVSWVKDVAIARRVAAVLMILGAMSALPAFAVPEVSLWARLVAGIAILSTIACVILLFYPDRSA